MAAIVIPVIAAFGHPVHHMPITQEQLSVTYFDWALPVPSPSGAYRRPFLFQTKMSHGVIPLQDSTIPHLKTKKYPDLNEDRVFLYIKAWQ